MKNSFAGQTVESARRTLATRFRSADVDFAELDARLLVGAVLKVDLTGLMVSALQSMTEAEAAELETFAQRRLHGEPVARILRQKEFWGLPIKLSAATLVPRPDTETVVELALEMAAEAHSGTFRLVDIGTGSGAILLALLHELPGAIGVGTDISLDALKTARSNAADLGMASRASFLACSFGGALSGSFDLIVSNPPYIRSGDIPTLAAEVRDHDPLAALDGGPDGLDAYRTLIPEAAAALVPGGALVVEAGQHQSGPIQALMAAAGLAWGGAAKTDLAGTPRAIAGRKMPR